MSNNLPSIHWLLDLFSWGSLLWDLRDRSETGDIYFCPFLPNGGDIYYTSTVSFTYKILVSQF